MNDDYLNQLIINYPNLHDLACIENSLLYKNESCSLENFNLKNFFNHNQILMQDLNNLNAKSVFDIIKIHLKYINIVNTNININSDNIIKQIRIIEKEDQNGFKESYIYFIDELGKQYIIPEPLFINTIDIYNQIAKEKYNNVSINDLINKINNNKRKQINIEEYFNYIKLENIDNQIEIQLKEFENYILELYKYKKYLLPKVKEILDTYLIKIKEIDNKNKKSKYEIKIINKINNNLKLNNTGYFNSIIIILLVLVFGLTISYMLLKVG